MALSAYFGNVLAQVCCASMMHACDDEDHESFSIDHVKKYVGHDISKIVERLRCSDELPLSEGWGLSDQSLEPYDKKLKQCEDSAGSSSPETSGGKSVDFAFEPSPKRDTLETVAVASDDLVALPPHCAGLLCDALGFENAAYNWFEKCMIGGDPLCMYKIAMRPVDLSKIDFLNDKTDVERIEHVRVERSKTPPNASLLDQLYSSDDPDIKRFGALGKARLAKTNDESLRFYEEAANNGMPQAYRSAALFADAEKALGYLQKAADLGILGAYEDIATRLLKKIEASSEERDSLIPQVIQAYTKMGQEGDSGGYLALGIFLFDQGRDEQAIESFKKAGKEGYRHLADLENDEEEQARLRAFEKAIPAEQLRQLRLLAYSEEEK